MSDSSEKKDVGRRETLKLAGLVAALGAGLSVSLHAEDANAEEQILSFKFFQVGPKGEAQLVHTVPLPEAVAKKLLEVEPSQLQWKCYTGKEQVVGAGPMPIKVARR